MNGCQMWLSGLHSKLTDAYFWPMQRLLLFLILFPSILLAQPSEEGVTLRGGIRPERTCYDVVYYDLHVKLNTHEKSIKGRNTVHFVMRRNSNKIQLDLFSQLTIHRIEFKNKEVSFKRLGNALFVQFPDALKQGVKDSLTIFYSGMPNSARKPPWDGGFVWSEDEKGRPFISVACEGHGASSWWPCKDHLYDEPDSMKATYTVQSELEVVGNGKLLRKFSKNDSSTYSWFVQNPINTYNICFYIGHFAHIRDTFKGVNTVPLHYAVLDYKKEEAMVHFAQVKPMLVSFEHFFGPYPFPEDGYKLVEAPYWGMEHQSAIAYGNQYENNKWGFDFIVVHESGHEWWGNNVSAFDHGDLWIHEAFTTYSEMLMLEHQHDADYAIKYLISQRKKIEYNAPIKGPYGVNFDSFGSADMYYKGSWMLHTLRTLLEDDSLWFDILRGLQKEFRFTQVSTQNIVRYINSKSGKDFSDFFDYYLNTTAIPVLEYKIGELKNGRTRMEFCYANCPVEFDMPVLIFVSGKRKWIYPTKTKKEEIIEANPNLIELSKAYQLVNYRELE